MKIKHKCGCKEDERLGYPLIYSPHGAISIDEAHISPDGHRCTSKGWCGLTGQDYWGVDDTYCPHCGYHLAADGWAHEMVRADNVAEAEAKCDWLVSIITSTDGPCPPGTSHCDGNYQAGNPACLDCWESCIAAEPWRKDPADEGSDEPANPPRTMEEATRTSSLLRPTRWAGKR